jgi:hypothetical protein
MVLSPSHRRERLVALLMQPADHATLGCAEAQASPWRRRSCKLTVMQFRRSFQDGVSEADGGGSL